MTAKKPSNSLLENAYKLSTPNDNIDYYRNFAATYDKDFADDLGYFYPQKISEIYMAERKPEDTPICDIGCGTGLIAEALKLPAEQIDGVDISAEMLDVSKDKYLYRDLYEVDLTQSVDNIKNNYGAVLSAGTFTSGHLGPKPLVALLDIARSDALFVIGVRDTFYKKEGFEAVILNMQESGAIKDLKLVEVPIYGKAGHEHSEDKGFALIYRKA